MVTGYSVFKNQNPVNENSDLNQTLQSMELKQLGDRDSRQLSDQQIYQTSPIGIVEETDRQTSGQTDTH